jgi:FkbM family methyltransferase
MLSIRNLAGLGKAEYLLRPHQIVRKLWREAEGQRREMKTVRLPWGLKIAVNTGDSIGWSLYTRAIYETPVTEALWRLVQPGDKVVDGGANIGYMTSVLAARVGAGGKLYCFEPHPGVFEALQRNVNAWQAHPPAPTFILCQAALGALEGLALLTLSDTFSTNQGVARIEPGLNEEEGRSLKVKVLALDDVIPKNETIRLVKLDVEGYELAALNGMENMLRARRVRHVVFEEVELFPAATHKFLSKLGYAIFGIERHFTGIRLVRDAQPEHDPVKGPPPNYLATVEPEFALSRLQRGIWQSFGPAQVLQRWR